MTLAAVAATAEIVLVVATDSGSDAPVVEVLLP